MYPTQSIPKDKTSAFECFFAAPTSCVDEFHRTNKHKYIFQYFGTFVYLFQMNTPSFDIKNTLMPLHRTISSAINLI